MFERILIVLSHDPQDPGDRASATSPPNRDDRVHRSLDRLKLCFPGLDTLVPGKRVLDFGCGHGREVVALAQAGAATAVGVDLNPRYLRHGQELARRHGVADRVEFLREVPSRYHGTFDLVVSQNAMEHVLEPDAVLEAMYRSLQPGGRAAITFSPPWLHPYGAHVRFFTPIPWVHLLFPERTVMRVRGRYRDDGARRYEDVEGGLNRMTIRRFDGLIQQSEFKVDELRLRAIKNLPFVTSVPLVREFLTSRVDALLAKEP